MTRAWKFLMDAGYIIEYKYRDGKRWEYVYEISILPFTEEQRQIIWQEATEEYGEIWGLDFEEFKMNSSKCTPQNKQISNTLSKQDFIKEIPIKEKEIIDDDETGQFSVNDFAFREFVSRWEKTHPSIFDNDTYNAIYQKMHRIRIKPFHLFRGKGPVLIYAKTYRIREIRSRGLCFVFCLWN